MGQIPTTISLIIHKPSTHTKVQHFTPRSGVELTPSPSLGSPKLQPPYHLSTSICEFYSVLIPKYNSCSWAQWSWTNFTSLRICETRFYLNLYNHYQQWQIPPIKQRSINIGLINHHSRSRSWKAWREAYQAIGYPGFKPRQRPHFLQ